MEESRYRLDYLGYQTFYRKITDSMSEEDSLGYCSTRQGKMEVLLVPAVITRQ
ncbi:hypothetical protein KIN20_026720 [Parelaphostrongylus tenuis]|uniref:Uncharacterized protein n=1 Tax=Parelaphostrongylus tenuis TaxID=148309 RepID=A0AAD5QYC9_PARTN|nr:hypothetical protein KIN20_026715 [Parelaphostrongylus tenuis]KAJ1366122.1 hypothetical protein KIN20_026720 [Parelaphostrongylus tenuis]